MIKKVKMAIIIFLNLVLIWFLYGYYTIYNQNQKLNDTLYINEMMENGDNHNEGDYELVNNDEKIIEGDINIEKYNYVGVLEIPKINFRKGFLPLNDYNNNVNRNIQVLKYSKMPDIDNSILAIAGHSGNASNAFFKYLYKLEVDDDVYVYYKNVKYIYKIYNIMRQDKVGYIYVNKSGNVNELVLTTCDSKDRSKQLIVIARLIDCTNY